MGQRGSWKVRDWSLWFSSGRMSVTDTRFLWEQASTPINHVHVCVHVCTVYFHVLNSDIRKSLVSSQWWIASQIPLLSSEEEYCRQIIISLASHPHIITAAALRLLSEVVRSAHQGPLLSLDTLLHLLSLSHFRSPFLTFATTLRLTAFDLPLTYDRVWISLFHNTPQFLIWSSFFWYDLKIPHKRSWL